VVKDVQVVADATKTATPAKLNDSFKARLDMMLRDVRVYGALLSRQRQADLDAADPCFLARHRKKS